MSGIRPASSGRGRRCEPSRSSAHTGSTRMPGAHRLRRARRRRHRASPCRRRRAGSAPTRRAGRAGASASGERTHAHVVTVPAGPTSTTSVRSSPVSGSYSVGGTSTRPSAPLMPTRMPSRSPVMNAPTTGPVVRLNGYSMTSGAVSTAPARRSATPGNVAQTRTRSRLLRSLAVAERQPLEEPTALSESVLWSLQREYFQREGHPRLGAAASVPDMITTNAVMGAAYARMVATFLREWRSRRSDATADPSHIVEIGAAPDASPTISSRSSSRASTFLCCSDVTVRYVMTDLPGGNVDRWRRHPYLPTPRSTPDGSTSPPSTPHGPDRSISSSPARSSVHGRTTAPLVVVANYLFDSLPLDAFLVDGRRARRVPRRRHRDGFRSRSAPELDDIELDWSRRPIGDAPRYLDAELEELLRTVTAGAAPRSVLFPTYGIHLLRELRTPHCGPGPRPLRRQGLQPAVDRVSSMTARTWPPTAASRSRSTTRSSPPTFGRRRGARAPARCTRPRSLTVVCLVLDEGAVELASRSPRRYRDDHRRRRPRRLLQPRPACSPTLEHPDARPAPRPSSVGRVGPLGLPAHVLRSDGSACVGGRASTSEVASRRRATGRGAATSRSARRPTSPSPSACSAGGPATPPAGLRLLRWSEKLHGLDADRDLRHGHSATSPAGDFAAAVESTTTAAPSRSRASAWRRGLRDLARTGDGRTAVGADPSCGVGQRALPSLDKVAGQRRLPASVAARA